ncbi:hypothetical protein WJX74_002106 [Apatococcus lobatus]|uniref:Uncharacterized protein n=1 Tax=Apatococcus lobatus TaxID=904363 RepID=A0AAW1RP41_9CHLO
MLLSKSAAPATATSSAVRCLSQRLCTSSAPRRQLGAQRAAVTTSRRIGRTLTLASTSSGSTADVTADGPGVATGSPWVPILATAGFAAAWIQKYTVHKDQVLVALATVALAQSALSLLKPEVHADWVSVVAAPAVLAWHALQTGVFRNVQFHYMEVAIAVFGWYLCKNLKGPALAWAATLGVALYSQYGATWYTAAYGVVAGWKLLEGYKNESKVAIQMIPPVLASVWALYKQAPLTWTIILMLSQIAGSALTMVQSVVKSVTN